MLMGFGFFLIFVAGAVGFGLFGLVLSRLIQTRDPFDAKRATYECGMNKIGEAQIQFEIKYYVFAVLFLLFDIEAVFLFPWAVAFDKVGLFGLIEVVIFILILVLGLAFAWKKGVLRWE